MEQRFYDMIESSPVIAAVKDMDGLKRCCELEDIKVVFILFGDICSITDIVKQIKASGKMAIVHIDLVAGLAPRKSLFLLSKHIQKQTASSQQSPVSSKKPGSCPCSLSFDIF